MTKYSQFALLFIVLVLAACQGAPAPVTPAEVIGEVLSEVQGQPVDVSGGTYTDVSVAELQSMLANKDFTFVNVHIPFEGDIANTDLSIPYNDIEQTLDQLPANKDAKLVLYCRSGRMSSIAAEKLVELGYSNVSNLAGGMIAWEQAGLPLEGK